MKTIPRVISALLLLFFSHQLIAQINEGGSPISFDLKDDMQIIKSISLQKPDMDRISADDFQRDTSFLPRRFMILLPLNIDFIQEGTWLDLEDGNRICRLKLQADGAKASNLYFDKFFLPNGVNLFLYDDSRNQLKGAYTSFNNPQSGNFAIELMAGETVILELNIPKEIKIDPEVNIAEFGYAYRDVPYADESKGFGSSNWCEININCSPEGDNWQVQKNGVVKILVKVSGSGFWCTGSLVNNTNFDSTPYVLTADHCAYQMGKYANEEDLNEWIFYFNYESATCVNPDLEPSILSMIGASKIAQGGNRGQDGSDFYLVLLNNEIPWNYYPYFLGWSWEDEGSDYGVTIHHPNGDIKKISTYISPLESSGWNFNGLQSHWKVIWAETDNNWGVTENGSSGSPLFGSSGKLIGTLTGGLAACDPSGSLGPDKPDYYGKFSYHWESNGTADTAQLRPWLDPADLGVQSITGWVNIDEHSIVDNLDIKIYPNPANEYFFINFTNLESKTYLISIYDIVGKLIKETDSHYQASELKINIANIPNGIYFISVQNDSKSIVKKLIVQ